MKITLTLKQLHPAVWHLPFMHLHVPEERDLPHAVKLAFATRSEMRVFLQNVSSELLSLSCWRCSLTSARPYVVTNDWSFRDAHVEPSQINLRRQ